VLIQSALLFVLAAVLAVSVPDMVRQNTIPRLLLPPPPRALPLATPRATPKVAPNATPKSPVRR